MSVFGPVSDAVPQCVPFCWNGLLTPLPAPAALPAGETRSNCRDTMRAARDPVIVCPCPQRRIEEYRCRAFSPPPTNRFPFVACASIPAAGRTAARDCDWSSGTGRGVGTAVDRSLHNATEFQEAGAAVRLRSTTKQRRRVDAAAQFGPPSRAWMWPVFLGGDAIPVGARGDASSNLSILAKEKVERGDSS